MDDQNDGSGVMTQEQPEEEFSYWGSVHVRAKSTI